MERTMTVQGEAKILVKPDKTLLKLTLESKHVEYDKTMAHAAGAVKRLESALQQVGFPKDSLTSLHFQVRADYENNRDEQGNYRQVFIGYCCDQTLQLQFACDSALLATALSAVTDSGVSPRIGIEFTVWDTDAVKRNLLRAATDNAAAAAKTLAEASGVVLGTLVSIEYGLNVLHVVSPTRFESDSRCRMLAANVPTIAPEDIELRDSVRFIWAIGGSGI